MRIREAQRACAALVGAVRMYLTVDATILDVLENLLLEKIVAVLVELIRCSNQWRQPVLRVLHPAAFAALERRIAFVGERVLDAKPIKGADQPVASVDFVHAELVSSFSEIWASTASRLRSNRSRACSAADMSMRIPRRRIACTIGSRSTSSRYASRVSSRSRIGLRLSNSISVLTVSCSA